MRVLVLGGYGLIGLEICKVLLRAGHGVVGLARSERRGRALLPEAGWRGADIAGLTRPQDWRPLLAGIDAVVNAAGLLQTGLKDDVAATQRDAIVALIAACEDAGPRKYIQISAPGAETNAATAFMRTKGQADAALRASALDWTIFRPGLVLAPTAYGGTSLLRMLTAFPLVQPIILPQARMQSVAVDEVAAAVLTALETDLARREFDLVEDEAHTLEEIVRSIRAWQGFAPARATWTLPRRVGDAIAAGADMAGWLGWRSALRSTAVKVLALDVVGDPAPWRQVGGGPLKSLQQTLRTLPSTAQERLYARGRLVFPVLLLLMSAFWIVSGLVAAGQVDAAAAVLSGRLPGWAILLGAAADIAIGLGLLVRRFVRPACIAAIAVCGAYLVGGTILAPQLWADPLGPQMKVFPVIALALAVAALAEER